ncbi:flagellar motor protein [Sulfuriferula nivalis]|uniref:Flagellar motor protein n=1 Tax=Sulfuriferula nivalis TaxID=2675298 RepID=A0A809SE62_9PROT|nr:flagellar motor protein [Sulfuriferula nivalis]BBP01137.1 flagellar motor protein [Sulfuriferula nivalis]
MDWGSLTGIILALAAVLVAHLLDGGHIGSLLQPAAFIIVVVGTLGAVLIQTRLPVFKRGMRMLRWLFKPPEDTRPAIMREIFVWSNTARREGLLSLEPYMRSSKHAFTAKGLRLIIDGIDAEKLRAILDTEIDAYALEQRQAVKIWEAAGGYSPTIGILGAVLGLIHVMENLTDPAKLGSGIAVAFVATIYGVGFANLFFLPISNRLKVIVNQSVRAHEMIADGLLLIINGENPHVVEDRLAAYLR